MPFSDDTGESVESYSARLIGRPKLTQRYGGGGELILQVTWHPKVPFTLFRELLEPPTVPLVEEVR